MEDSCFCTAHDSLKIHETFITKSSADGNTNGAASTNFGTELEEAPALRPEAACEKETVVISVYCFMPSPLTSARYTEDSFHGVCVNLGAEHSVAGLVARAVCSRMALPFELSNVSFRFGDVVGNSMGKMGSRLDVPGGFFLAFELYVVQADLPLLLGFDFLPRFNLSLDFANTLLCSRGSAMDI